MIENKDILARKSSREGNEAWRLKIWLKLLKVLAIFASGSLYAVSIPPLEISTYAWIGLVPLFFACFNVKRLHVAFFRAFLWGTGWSFCAFFFLREIEFIVPFLIAPILGMWFAVWGACFGFFSRNVFIPAEVQLQGYEREKHFSKQHITSVFKQLLLCLTAGGLWVVMELTLSKLLPWNCIAVSQYRNIPLIQICEYTGTYGVSFLIVFTNCAIMLMLKDTYINLKKKQFHRPIPFIAAILILFVCVLWGNSRALKTAKLYEDNKNTISLRAALIQGNISQRRRASDAEAAEALQIYLQLSRAISSGHPEIIIWPETAVPYPYYGNNMICLNYRYELYSLMKDHGVSMLIGTIKFGTRKNRFGNIETFNSAFLLKRPGVVADTFSKIHLVPFGEYVPFRAYLPAWLTRAIDMARDLSEGSDYEPMELKQGVYAGINICFEDVFAYIARREAQLGANMLLVITNDAWYPKSSEPDQHLANAVFRTVETRLPLLRSGNNSGSCLISPSGTIIDCVASKQEKPGASYIPAPELRTRAAGIINVQVLESPQQTFYTKYGNVFAGICALISVLSLFSASLNTLSKHKKTAQAFEGGGRGSDV